MKISKKYCILVFLFVIVVALSACSANTKKSNDDLYTEAVRDAIIADEDEIYPIVSLVTDSDMVIWNDDKTKVLLTSWCVESDNYEPANKLVVSESDIWVFSKPEMQKWYNENHNNVLDWNLRFKQLIGLPERDGCTQFSSFWVDVKNVIRPAVQTDVTLQVSKDDLSEPKLGNNSQWYNDNIIFSYFKSAKSTYPWTRLGYTYDWNPNSSEYGLTEFLIRVGF